jgi:predicted nucleotidyltransferase
MILSAPKRSVLKRNSRLQAEKGSSADERTDLIGNSIIKTLKYSDHFGFPLTVSEIHQRLISQTTHSKEQVIKSLDSMVKSNQIQNKQEYYFLPGKKSLVAQRINHLKASKPQLARVKQMAHKLSQIPFVKAIYLTGSLAMNNSKTDSDIDFMIITKEGRLWTTRFILTLYTSLLGLRRTPGSRKNAGKLCLNLYLTPDSYLLPTHKQSIYTAYELIQAVPVYDPRDTRTALLAANPWIKYYLSNVITGSDLSKRTLLKRNPRLQAEEGPAAAGRRVLMGTIENLLFNLQYLYMRPKLTREYITINSAFFHPHDPSPQGL